MLLTSSLRPTTAARGIKKHQALNQRCRSLVTRPVTGRWSWRMSQLSTGLGDIEKPRASNDRLAVAPLEAARLLSVCLATVYGLMRRGELPSFRSGRSRRIAVQSIYDYIDRRLAASAGGWQQQTRRRRRNG